MTSRELLVMIEGLSADSWFKTSAAADLRALKVDAERAAMHAAHNEIEDHLEGRALIPGAMPIGVIDKHTPVLRE